MRSAVKKTKILLILPINFFDLYLNKKINLTYQIYMNAIYEQLPIRQHLNFGTSYLPDQPVAAKNSILGSMLYTKGQFQKSFFLIVGWSL